MARVSHRQRGVQLQGVAELTAGGGPIPFDGVGVSEGAVRFSQSFVNLKGSVGSAASFFQGVGGVQQAGHAQHIVGLGETRIGLRMGGVLMHGLLPVVARLPESAVGESNKVMVRGEMGVMGDAHRGNIRDAALPRRRGYYSVTWAAMFSATSN